MKAILSSAAMALNILVLQSISGISLALIFPNQRCFVPSCSRSKTFGASTSRGKDIGHRRWNEAQSLPFHYSPTNLRPIHAVNNEEGGDDEIPKVSNKDNTAIPEKIRWIFDEADSDFFDDDVDDDSFFDDLFLTDDEDDGYSDGGDFITDDNDEDGPDASLNEDDLMLLHDMYPASELGTNHSSSTTPSTEGLPTISKAASTKDNNTIPTTLSVDNILASLESDLSYFYLRDELGISEDVMWKITNEAPSVLGLKANNVRNKVRVLQSLVGFSDEEIRRLITSQPTLLQLSVKKNLSPSILYWIRQLEIGKEELKTLILGCPALLKYSRANIQGKLTFFQTVMGYSLSECRKLLLQEPRLLTSSVKTGLIPRLDFLNKEVEISLPDIRKIVRKNPRVLLMSVEQNLTPKCVFYFIMTLQMDTKDVVKLLLKYPQILDYNLEHHILPIHHYFLSLDFSTYEFSRIIQRFPRLITNSLAHTKRRIGYLRFELYLEADAIRRILYQCPQIVSLGQENLETTVDFLLQTVAPGTSLVDSENETLQESSELVETDDRDALAILQILIAGLPTLLGLSIEKNLRPKVEYLRETLGQEELSGALLRLPALLGYSLEKRIKPRLESMSQAKVPLEKITYAIPLKQDAFDEWLERQIQNAGTPRRSTRKRNLSKTATASNTAVVVEPAPAALAVAVPIIDQIEETTRKEPKIEKKDPPEASEDDDTDANGGNSRVVEEGGKIIHWRRKRG